MTGVIERGMYLCACRHCLEPIHQHDLHADVAVVTGKSREVVDQFLCCEACRTRYVGREDVDVELKPWR